MFDDHPPTSALNITLPVKHQADGRREYVEHGGALCSRCKVNPPKVGQRYCETCLAVAMRECNSRKRQEKIAALQILVQQLGIAGEEARRLIRRDAARRSLATTIADAKAKIARLQETERHLAEAKTSLQEAIP